MGDARLVVRGASQRTHAGLASGLGVPKPARHVWFQLGVHRGLLIALVSLLCVWGSSSSAEQAATRVRERAPALRNPRLFSPLPGGYVGGWPGDTGLDIAASFRPVYALAAGTLEYSERGHTLWQKGRDTPNSVRLKLDEPIPWKDRHGVQRQITHVYYTHLSAVDRVVAAGAEASTKPHVAGGQRLGVSGIGNGVAHLHLGLLLDGQVEQDSWDSLLVDAEVRRVMGGYKNGEMLPEAAPARHGDAS